MKYTQLLPIFLTFSLAACALGGPSTANQTPESPVPAPEVQALSGHLENQIEILEKNLPGAGSQAFVVPTDQEMADFAELIRVLLSGDPASASRLAGENHYELIRYTDKDDHDAESYLLREQKPILKGWGLYLIRTGTAQDILLEAPHPISDEGTPLIAAHAYQALRARALLVSGSHRDANRDQSADVAHSPRSIFQAIHRALLESTPAGGGAWTVLQIHGFASNKHPQYPQVVLGYDKSFQLNPFNDLNETRLVKSLADALSARKVATGICDGFSWQDLCGETNVQAGHVKNEIFVHVELDTEMRDDDRTFLKALKKVFPPPGD
jgi:hypothetical protein